MVTVEDFLTTHGWNDAEIDWFDADWSVRRYARLRKADGSTALLLDSLPDDAPEAMVGHMLGPWIKMNKHFHTIGVNVPDIYVEDQDSGFILMQDFGNDTIAGKGVEAYLKATDILTQMRDHPDALSPLSSPRHEETQSTNLHGGDPENQTPAQGGGDGFLKYEDSHVYKALRFYPEWILNNASLTDDWLTTWKTVEKSLPPCSRALTHMDFHPGNLMWMNGTIGVIDFQAACNGPFVYDIVNLLEDIRIDVPKDIKDACKEKYRATLSPQDQEIFDQWYPVITAQFHARILGQIIKLKDERGRDDLMIYFKSTLERFEAELEHPSLGPIKNFIETHKNDRRYEHAGRAPTN